MTGVRDVLRFGMMAALALAPATAHAADDTQGTAAHDVPSDAGASSGTPTAAAAPQTAAAAAPKKKMSRGEYLATAGDCVACHTRDGGKPFEGGLGINTPFGMLYTPNITSSKEHGIGTFTDEQFLKAFHNGIRPDGKPYYPAFPYTSYTKVTTEDALAIKEYLFSLTPSDYVPPKNEMHWPFDVRDGLFAWRDMYFDAGRYQPDASKSDVWNRGAYLVEGLGHCGECHTPRNQAEAMINRDALSGAMIDGWYAPNISSDLRQGIGDWSQADLEQYLSTGIAQPKLKGGGPDTAALGPMAEVIHDSLSHLNKDDIHAIAFYLKNSEAKEEPHKERRQYLSAAELKAGKKIYDTNCAPCHQSSGQGSAPYFPALRDNPVVTNAEPNDVVMTILHGAPSDPSEAFSPYVQMPPFASQLSDKDIAAVASYVRMSWGNDGGLVAERLVRELRKKK